MKMIIFPDILVSWLSICISYLYVLNDEKKIKKKGWKVFYKDPVYNGASDIKRFAPCFQAMFLLPGILFTASCWIKKNGKNINSL